MPWWRFHPSNFSKKLCSKGFSEHPIQTMLPQNYCFCGSYCGRTRLHIGRLRVGNGWGGDLYMPLKMQVVFISLISWWKLRMVIGDSLLGWHKPSKQRNNNTRGVSSVRVLITSIGTAPKQKMSKGPCSWGELQKQSWQPWWPRPRCRPSCLLSQYLPPQDQANKRGLIQCPVLI